MSDIDDREIRRALGPGSRSRFDDIRRRLEADRPGECGELQAEVTSLATGAREPEAARHAAGCARCRDQADQARDVWRRLAWPASNARFDGLRSRLIAPLPFRPGRFVAAALLAAAVVGALAWPRPSPPTGGAPLARRLENDGLGLRVLAELGTERAARTLLAIGGPEAEALLIGMMGRNRDIDAVVTRGLAADAPGPLHPADLVREWRPDLLAALIDSAPPGSATTIIPALFEPDLAARAARALERLPHDEAAAALELAGVGATLEEAGVFAERSVAVAGALKAATGSRLHRQRCFWRAVAGSNSLDFLFAAAGSSLFREDALMFIGLLPDDVVVAACRDALRNPVLAAGAARAAARLGDRRLVPALIRAAKEPPPGMGSAGFEMEKGDLVSARSESFESVCLDAVAQITRQ
ncbi:MAG TPA: hypothetical protein VFT32_07660 [Candidatus Eisenbacteria bacterium]|nr:hypothetical protein [Candidatus Eisenbacteria bacterium]